MNQEIFEDTINFIENFVLNLTEGCWVVTLYDKNIANEKSYVDLNEESFIKFKDSYIIQHPFIISKEILNYQKKENFKYKIEETIKRVSRIIKIKGVFAEMPPEFDNEKMLENTKKYLKIKDTEIILLPGNNISNKKWIEKVKDELKIILPHSKIYYYNHWKENKEVLNFDYELEKLEDEISRKKRTIIFAKSVGAVLSIKLIQDKKIRPGKCIFVGLPVKWAIENNLNFIELIKDYNVPTLFIQNDNDSFCSYNELGKLLNEKSVRNFRVVKSKGNNHDYEDYNLMRKEISAFLED